MPAKPPAASRRTDWDGAIADLPNYLYDENTPRLLATPKYSAYIKIAEGCDHPCSFCIIPQLRGKFRSRRFESVIAEAQRLAEQGVREITLIGQDTTCYGEDLGLKDGLALLLERLAQIEELRWVRFLYAYPNKITGKLLRDHRRPRKDLLLHRRAVAARLARGFEAHEARRRRRHLPALHREDAARDSRSHTAHLVHRRLPRRDARRISNSSASSCARRSSTGWASLATPTRRGPEAFALADKVPRERDRAPPQEADVDAEADQPQEKARAGRAAVRSAAGRARRQKPSCCGKAAPRCMLPRSTARFTSTISAITKMFAKASSIAARSPKRTTTIWWRAL